mgnify:CR=1 FL=1
MLFVPKTRQKYIMKETDKDYIMKIWRQAWNLCVPSLLLVCSTEELKIHKPHHVDPLTLLMPKSICGLLKKPIQVFFVMGTPLDCPRLFKSLASHWLPMPWLLISKFCKPGTPDCPGLSEPLASYWLPMHDFLFQNSARQVYRYLLPKPWINGGIGMWKTYEPWFNTWLSMLNYWLRQNLYDCQTLEFIDDYQHQVYLHFRYNRQHTCEIKFSVH